MQGVQAAECPASAVACAKGKAPALRCSPGCGNKYLLLRSQPSEPNTDSHFFFIVAGRHRDLNEFVRYCWHLILSFYYKAVEQKQPPWRFELSTAHSNNLALSLSNLLTLSSISSDLNTL